MVDAFPFDLRVCRCARSLQRNFLKRASSGENQQFDLSEVVLICCLTDWLERSDGHMLLGSLNIGILELVLRTSWMFDIFVKS
jgi:hypothetical protein